jgi:predicted nucleic acid-binding protein
MNMAVIRTYCDTSVFGGVFDDEFSSTSRTFFQQVKMGRFRLLVSDITRAEVAGAPSQVKELFDGLLGDMELVAVNEHILTLRDAYVKAGIVGARSKDDAAHVAAATVAGAELIVSWNFRHIVHFDKIRHYNEVNTAHGFSVVDIHSPLEVVEYEDEERL